MREIKSHIVNECNDKITIKVTDEPGSGGANHLYIIEGFNTGTNKSEKNPAICETTILFQNGPIKECGTNGITHEVLLAILEDRLKSFQNGPYACEENAKALQHIQDAQKILQDRTRARMARGVEGTHKV